MKERTNAEILLEAHQLGYSALKIQEQITFDRLVRGIMFFETEMEIVLDPNEDSSKEWLNTYAPYYKAFIAHLRESKVLAVARMPNIKIDAKNERITVKYKLNNSNHTVFYWKNLNR